MVLLGYMIAHDLHTNYLSLVAYLLRASKLRKRATTRGASGVKSYRLHKIKSIGRSVIISDVVFKSLFPFDPEEIYFCETL